MGLDTVPMLHNPIATYFSFFSFSVILPGLLQQKDLSFIR